MNVLNNPRQFTEIQAIAEDRHGGASSLMAKMPELPTPQALAEIPDHRWLSGMTKRIFQAGFNWDLIEQKWPAFEDAFEGFEPERWRMMSDGDLDRLLADTRIVRNGAKISTVQANAELLCDLAKSHGSAARAIADWPSDDFVGLLNMLQKRGSRLGGTTAQWFLRGIGKDGFVLTKDVAAALIREKIVTKVPTSQRDFKAVQNAFNQWRAESGLPLAHISRILACSVPSAPNPRHIPL
ncbi:MAG: DNA-3-methyladenine glycosylase I [Pseudomonadota bacterium]